MKARMPAGFGRPDMNALMRQAQKMQDDMKAKQAELEAAEYTGSAWWPLPSTPPSSRWTKLPRPRWAS